MPSVCVLTKSYISFTKSHAFILLKKCLKDLPCVSVIPYPNVTIKCSTTSHTTSSPLNFDLWPMCTLPFNQGFKHPWVSPDVLITLLLKHPPSDSSYINKLLPLLVLLRENAKPSLCNIFITVTLYCKKNECPLTNNAHNFPVHWK